MFKCMSGFTTDNGKFIMALPEKLSYDNSIDRCERFGFKRTFLWLHLVKNGNKSAKTLTESLENSWTTDSSFRRRK